MTIQKNKAEKELDESTIQKLVIDDVVYTTTYNKKFMKRKSYQAKNPKHVIAFIPGKIKKINVKRGSKVKEGDKLLILEAMKMNNAIFAPMKGVIKEVYVTQGISVAKDALLVEFE